MRTIAIFCLVCSFCYVSLFAMEYSKYVRGQNWTPATARVKRAINSIPLTKFEPHRMNEIATIVNWSYIEYEYKVGDGIYQHTEELGPHLTVFDYMVSPMAYRFKKDDIINIKYNEHDPKESVFGFEIFRPVETLGGTALAFFLVAVVLLLIERMLAATTTTDTENLPY